MDKYIKFLDKFKWLIVTIIPIVVITLSLNLKHLGFEGSYRVWFGEDSKILNGYDKFRKVFGNDDALIIAFEDKEGIFTPKALESIQRLTKELWQMKYVARVDSLTNYQYIHADPEYPDEIIVEDFITELKNRDKKYFENRKKIALDSEVLNGALINQNATTTMISARMVANVSEDEDKSFEIMDALNTLIKKESELTGYKFWLNGGAPLTVSFVTIAQNDGSIFTPLSIVSVMFLLGLLFRKVSGVFIPMAVVIFTMLTVLSIQVLLGYKLNNFTANIPVFVVAIGIADAVHIYIVWLLFRQNGEDNATAIRHTLQKNMLPIFLTSLTTSVGFASLTISEIVPVATLGIATASAAILAFVLSIVLMPSMLLMMKKAPKSRKVKEESFFQYFNYGKFIIDNSNKIILFSTFLFIFFAAGLYHVRIDSNTIRYFDKEVEIRKSTNFLMENLTGPMAYEIVVDSKSKDGIKDPKFLNTVDRFYKEFQEKFPDARHISSLLDVIKEFHKVMNGGDKSFYKVPDTKELSAQYLLLYSLSLPQGMEINDKMDIEQRLLRVTAQMNLVDTSKDLQMIAWAENWWKDTPYSAIVEGQTAMFAYMQSDVTQTLLYSMSIAIAIVSVIMILIFKNIKLIPIFILPNLLPLILVMGVMGWLNIDIDLGVAVSGAIILGVAVDDTIHFLVKYFEAQKQGKNVEESLNYVLRYAGKAILFTTVILSLSFLTFIGNSFAPNINFGIVTASALFIAVIADILLLPAILSKVAKDTHNY